MNDDVDVNFGERRFHFKPPRGVRAWARPPVNWLRRAFFLPLWLILTLVWLPIRAVRPHLSLSDLADVESGTTRTGWVVAAIAWLLLVGPAAVTYALVHAK